MFSLRYEGLFPVAVLAEDLEGGAEGSEVDDGGNDVGPTDVAA